MVDQPVSNTFKYQTSELPNTDFIPEVGIIDNPNGNIQSIDLPSNAYVLTPSKETSYPGKDFTVVYVTFPPDTNNELPKSASSIPEVTTVWFVQPPGKEPVYVVRVEIPPTETFTVPPGGKPFTPEYATSNTLPQINDERTVLVVNPTDNPITYQVCE
uniref:Uncharacterized protein n=1 Tax=Biomphalaria glabrata TaxID=6526 RepID=A0A2C9LXH3_BIOGL